MIALLLLVRERPDDQGGRAPNCARQHEQQPQSTWAFPDMRDLVHFATVLLKERTTERYAPRSFNLRASSKAVAKYKIIATTTLLHAGSPHGFTPQAVTRVAASDKNGREHL